MHFNIHTYTGLYTGENRIGDEGVKHLCDALRIYTYIPTYIHIHTGENRIGDEGVKHLCDALQVNTSLDTLILASNYISTK
jgi:hypothetical protein